MEIKSIGIVIHIYLKLYSGFTVRYHWCYAPRYRLDVVYLHKFGATQLMYDSVTLARCATLPYGYSLPHTISRGFLSILTVDFPSLLRSLVNLTFGRKRCSESVVVSLLHLLLPCFSQGRLTRTRT